MKEGGLGCKPRTGDLGVKKNVIYRVFFLFKILLFTKSSGSSAEKMPSRHLLYERRLNGKVASRLQTRKICTAALLRTHTVSWSLHSRRTMPRASGEMNEGHGNL